jgi:hypothetical protein
MIIASVGCLCGVIGAVVGVISIMLHIAKGWNL